MKKMPAIMAMLFATTIGLYTLGADPPPLRPSDEAVRQPVASDVFRTVAYRDCTKTLMLVFRNGRAYEYAGVPRACYEGLVLTRRKGSYFNRRIRGCFPCRRIDVDP